MERLLSPLADVIRLSHRCPMRSKPSVVQRQNNNGHAAFTMLVVNGLLMGMTLATFAQGPYASFEQEVWYRYGSIGMFLVGVVMPAFPLFLLRRSQLALLITTIWTSAALIAYLTFIAMSGGGV